MATIPDTIIGLDVGAKRVGVAVASLTARLPRPLITLNRGEAFFSMLTDVVNAEGARALVVGFPRGMQGQHTRQTGVIEDFTAELRHHFTLPIQYQDEALTSRHAEAELEARGKPYQRGDIDALAATYILEDFLSEHHDLRLEELAQ